MVGNYRLRFGDAMRLRDQYLYKIHINSYIDTPSWEVAMGFVKEHFRNGFDGHYAIFRYPDRLRGTQRWIVVRTDTP